MAFPSSLLFAARSSALPARLGAIRPCPTPEREQRAAVASTDTLEECGAPEFAGRMPDELLGDKQ